MKHQIRHMFIPNLLILLTVILHPTAARALEVGGDEEVEFSYEEGSAKGPQHWGDLKQEWAACKYGDMQSPIDLSSQRVKVVPKLGQLKNSYEPQNAVVINKGHDIQVSWEGNAGSILINGTQFFLQQAHWHWPSEHTINGRRYELELHMVHVSPQPDGKNKTAVVGLLYKFGPPDPFLSKLAKYIEEIHEEDQEKSIGVIDPSEIKIDGNMYYRYMGSLTTPPCTEGVIWTINKKITTVSREQVKVLKDAVVQYYAKRNARPLQPLNMREIQLHVPKATSRPQN